MSQTNEVLAVKELAAWRTGWERVNLIEDPRSRWRSSKTTSVSCSGTPTRSCRVHADHKGHSLRLKQTWVLFTSKSQEYYVSYGRKGAGIYHPRHGMGSENLQEASVCQFWGG